MATSKVLHLGEPKAEASQDQFSRWGAHYVISEYLAFSSMGRLQERASFRGDWLKGLWKIREDCGSGFADSLVVYTAKAWEITPGYI
jgi:hypothetical protein